MNKDIFYMDFTPGDGKYMIRVDSEILGAKLSSGSWNVLPAHLLHISYADWLRFARDEFGAELRGKKSLYVVPYFSNTEQVRDLIRLLNKYAKVLITEYENIQLRKELDERKNSIIS